MKSWRFIAQRERVQTRISSNPSLTCWNRFVRPMAHRGTVILITNSVVATSMAFRKVILCPCGIAPSSSQESFLPKPWNLHNQHSSPRIYWKRTSGTEYAERNLKVVSILWPDKWPSYLPTSLFRSIGQRYSRGHPKLVRRVLLRSELSPAKQACCFSVETFFNTHLSYIFAKVLLTSENAGPAIFLYFFHRSPSEAIILSP